MASHIEFSIWVTEVAAATGTPWALLSDKSHSSWLGKKQEDDSEEPRNFDEEGLK